MKFLLDCIQILLDLAITTTPTTLHNTPHCQKKLPPPSSSTRRSESLLPSWSCLKQVAVGKGQGLERGNQNGKTSTVLVPWANFLFDLSLQSIILDCNDENGKPRSSRAYCILHMDIRRHCPYIRTASLEDLSYANCAVFAVRLASSHLAKFA